MNLHKVWRELQVVLYTQFKVSIQIFCNSLMNLLCWLIRLPSIDTQVAELKQVSNLYIRVLHNLVVRHLPVCLEYSIGTRLYILGF